MEPLANPTPPAPVPPPPVITTPSVFETKPGKDKKKGGAVRAWITTGILIFLVLIVILYFWGAHLADQA
jgi:hypothetical protein